MIRRMMLLMGVLVAAVLAGPSVAVAAPGDDVVKVAVVRTPEQNGGRPDSLAQIAQRTLGDANRSGEILDLNRDRPQSDGGALDDAGQIRAGWILLLPDDADGPDVKLGRVGSQQSGTDTNTDAPFFTGRLVLSLVGALILALLTVVLFFGRRILRWIREKRRIRADNARLHREIQQRLRERGELVGAFAADEAGPRSAWFASTELAAAGVETYALRVGDREITAWVTSGQEPPVPWREQETGIWVRPADVPGRQLRDGELPPCLVRVGGGRDGALLVDLTWLDGVLAIGGSTGVAADVLRILLADLARFRPELPVLSVPGLAGEPVGVPDTAIRFASITDLSPSGPGSGTDDGMVRLAARRCALRALIVIADPPSPEQAEHLFAVCGPGTGQVAIVLGDLPGARWRWTADVDGALHLPSIAATVTAPAR